MIGLRADSLAVKHKFIVAFASFHPCRVASGRGAYVCPQLDCLNKARKAKALERALSCEIPAAVYEKLTEQMEAGD